ncbi:hypothetical protein KKE26_08125 [bacterium]|nr:hypothetical protein [bacterium]
MATNNCNVCNEEMIEEVNDTLKQFERNKYFYGKLMTVKDFELEQGYFNGKRHLLNRLIHGVGIARGLKVTTPTLTGTTLKIALSSGVALDCWGREIVVDKEYSELNVTGTLGGDTKGYLYIKQKPCLKDPVPVLSNASTCEQECCYSRIKEDFEVIVSNIAPPVPDFLLDVGKYWKKDGEVYKDVNPVMGDIKSNEADWHEAEIIIAINEYLEKIGCPSCNDSKVLLAVIEKKADGSIVVNNTETHKYRSIVYNNPMLYDLISSHLVDFSNPHNVTAQQTGAIKSINSVSNPGGNIDLVTNNAIVITPDDTNNKITIGETHSALSDNPHGTTAVQVGALVSIGSVSNPGGNIELVRNNAIVITSDDTNNKITIGETHSARLDNPHGTTAAQVGALVSIGSVSNPGGNIELVRNNAIVITSDDNNNKITISENHSARKNNPHETTAAQVGALVSIGSVSNPGGNVELVAGANIIITTSPAPAVSSITIASTAGVEPAVVVTSVGNIKKIGESLRYAREDHVHNLEDDIQEQLSGLVMYVRERALKCTMINFKEVGEKFNNKTALELSNYSKGAIDEKRFKKEREFIEVMNQIFERQSAIATGIKTITTEGSWKDFSNSLKELKTALESGNSLKIATAQDEVCFYSMLLKRRKLSAIILASNLDGYIVGKINDDLINAIPSDMIRNEVKTELENVNTATIINEVYKNPDINPSDLTNRTGIKTTDINKKIDTLVKGGILVKSGIGYRLNI